jgi:DNA-binding LytR/AlgR family response regulator
MKALNEKNFGIDFNEVVYLASDINYTFVHFQNGNQQIHAYTLKMFENFLSQSANFVRIHRKFLVNRQFIDFKTENHIKLLNGNYLPIARRRRICKDIKYSIAMNKL